MKTPKTKKTATKRKATKLKVTSLRRLTTKELTASVGGHMGSGSGSCGNLHVSIKNTNSCCGC